MSRNNRTCIWTVLVFAVLLLTGTVAFAQYGGGNSGGGMGGGGMSGGGMSGGGMGGNSGGGGGSGMGGGGGAGVMIQTNGILQTVSFDSKNLDQKRLKAFYQALPSDIKTPVEMRKVSLNRLENCIKANNGTVTEEMFNLAGLQKIEYVFFYPETGDVVIAGPAEGWTLGSDGAVVGYKSKLPTLKLVDLVVALRAFPTGGNATSLIGCSIDPTEEGLRNMQNFLNTAKVTNVSNQSEVQEYARGLKSSLGLQSVKIWGVSPKTGFAQKLVAADYRMKLIGIGLEPAPVRMDTYADRSTPSTIVRNGLVRWWFQPDYKCVTMAEDHNAMQITGNGVLLRGEDELVSEDGKRHSTGTAGNRATKAYANSFTKSYTRIAQKVPVYAALRNLIDMTIVAAYLQKEDIYTKANWKMDLFGDEKKFPLEIGTPIQQADSAVNILRHGAHTVSFPTGGGVQIQPTLALEHDNLSYEKNSKITNSRPSVDSMKVLPKDVWWWN